jgi:hypothetical protein
MARKRFVQNTTVTVDSCPRCGETHTYPFEILFDREMDAIGFFMTRNFSEDVAVTCLKTKETIILTVPFTLDSLETFVEVRKKN